MFSLRPTYRYEEIDLDIVRIHVTAPPVFGGKTHTIDLDTDQYERFCMWRDQKGLLIQNMLPDLTISQRELIMTGMDDETYEEIIGSKRDDER